MLPLQIVLLASVLLPASLFASHAGKNLQSAKDTEDKAKKDCRSIYTDSNKTRKAIRKRLIHLPARPETEAALIQAGILTANYPLVDNDEPIFHGYDQNNDPGTSGQQSEEALLQQGDIPLASRHPTKPVYHYTPLPPGTFRVQSSPTDKTEDEDSSYAVSNWFSYLVQEKKQGLDLGRREIREGDSVRGVYHVLLPDRRMQVVNYWSDWTGFHPTITYTYT